MTDRTLGLEYRDRVIARIHREIVGPARGAFEIVSGRPTYRYLTGMLFPSESEASFQGDLETEDSAVTPGSLNESADAAVAAAYDLLPSSMGISFLVVGAPELVVRVRGARYRGTDLGEIVQGLGGGEPDSDDHGHLLENLRSLCPSRSELFASSPGVDLREEDIAFICGSGGGVEDERDNEANGSESSDLWQRIPLVEDHAGEEVRFPIPPISETDSLEMKAFGGRARVLARFRPVGNGHHTTITVCNAQTPASTGVDSSIEATLFQVDFDVRVIEGEIGSYPDTDRLSLHEEDEELALIYRDSTSKGIGHGCSATWPTDLASGPTRAIGAVPLPRFTVKGLTNAIEIPRSAASCLDLAWLADPARTDEELKDSLTAFVDAYAAWVAQQGECASEGPLAETSAASRLIERQRLCVKRMRGGVAALTGGNEVVREAFRIAQEAMLTQFLWAKHRSEGPFDLGNGLVGEVSQADPAPHWYPFQLGYQLLVLESLIDHDSPDRELVDLLWFPTGGGKTEAYLALAAFEMAFRRLKYQDQGTAVIMRYTLRLLTTQQFERCAAMMCALESIRRSREDLGESAFRLGLWVGGGLTPNRMDNDNERSPGASQRIEMMREEAQPENPFMLRACPRCGTRIVPRDYSSDRSTYGVSVEDGAFVMKCPDRRCELHSGIPCSVVDDDLYLDPPTFLIGTIDKFARMAWEARSRTFLGGGGQYLPPSLIIQDELHLITGPLGSISGTYEAAIESVIQAGGLKPKYLASTATIQRADEQCQALYARNAFVYPPSGLDVEDSFFSRIDAAAPGREYIGVMGNGLYSSLTALVQVSAAAAQAAMEIPANETLARDSYWTQVIFHNSKQELGKTTTMIRDDVDTRLKVLEPNDDERRPFEVIDELSANLKGSMVGDALERLESPWTPGEGNSTVDAVACTNMLSVGVDIGRLGLMLMKGQPKGTAEYIQATSRVGRDWKHRPPGIVLTLYSPLRPRDRSHFEAFQAFHQALYRQVEPTSVTPFSPRARERTLHAALVIALRLAFGWTEPQSASNFDPEDREQADLIQTLRRRLLAACQGDEREEVARDLDRLIEQWRQEKVAVGGPPLSFNSGRQFRNLLSYFGTAEAGEGLWPTLNSMRHVDGETPFAIRGAR